MTMEVRGPGGIVVRFPDGTDTAIIDKVMRDAAGQSSAPAPQVGGATPAAAAPNPQQPQAPSRGGFMDVVGGLASLVNPVAAIGQAGTGNPAMSAAAQGMTAGFADEIGGVAGGAIEAAQGGSFSQGYDRTVGTARSDLNKFRESNPVGAGVMETAGALLTTPVAGAVNVVRAPATAGALARGGAATVNAAATGAAYGSAGGMNATRYTASNGVTVTTAVDPFTGATITGYG